MIQTIYADRSGFQKSIEQARQAWISEILLFIGIDYESLVELEKDQIREIFIEYNIEIVEYLDINACMIYFEGNVIGEWLGPEFKLMKDENGTYYEITIESWSIIEDEEQEEHD